MLVTINTPLQVKLHENDMDKITSHWVLNEINFLSEFTDKDMVKYREALKVVAEYLHGRGWEDLLDELVNP